MLLGSFLIGILTGDRGQVLLKPFLVDAFPGFLCLFLLDMGLVAGRGLRDERGCCRFGWWRSLSSCR